MNENPGAELSLEVIEGTFDLARQGRVGPLGEMIEAGVPVDTRNPRGDSMLIVAAYAEQADVVAELIRRGAHLDFENSMGQTAVSCAVFRGDERILGMLLDAGANPNVGFRTGLQIAQQFQRENMIGILTAWDAAQHRDQSS